MYLSEDLLTIILYVLNKQSVCIRAIIQKFPYQSLVEKKYDDVNLSLILEVVNLFMTHESFTLNPDFIIPTTKFGFDAFASISEANEDVNQCRSIIRSLRRLLVVASRLGIRVNINTEYIQSYQKVICKAENTEIVEHLFDLIGVFIEYHQVHYDVVFNEAMKLTWEKFVPPEKRFHFALTMILFSKVGENQIIHNAGNFFMQHLPNLDAQSEPLQLSKLIDACVNIFNHFSDIRTQRKFAIRMFQCNSLRTLKNKALNIDCCIDLFTKQLQIVFAPIYWDVYAASEEHYENNLDIVVTYLEFMYTNGQSVKSVDQDAIAKLIDKHDQNLPIHLPVLKSFIMLFSLYATRSIPIAKYGIQKELLDDLDRNSHRLGSMLTFHEIQLMWILKEGNHGLRTATLLQWMAQIDSDKQIQRIAFCIESTDRIGDAISILLHSKSMNLKRMILKLLNAIKPLMVSIETLRLISTEPLDKNAIEILFEINPQVPEISSGVQWSTIGNSEQDSIDFVIKLLREMSHILIYKDMSRRPCLKIKIGEFLLELIRQNASYIKQLLPVVLATHFVSSLTKDLKEAEGEILSNAAELLYLIIDMQVKLKHVWHSTYPVLVMHKVHNPSVQKLLLKVLNCNDFVGAAVYIADDDLLYEKLLTVLDSLLGNFALQALQMLMALDSNLLFASINNEFIIHWAEAQTINSNVLRFVIYWTNMCATSHFENLDFPVLALEQIIATLEESCSTDLDFSSLKHNVAKFKALKNRSTDFR